MATRKATPTPKKKADTPAAVQMRWRKAEGQYQKLSARKRRLQADLAKVESELTGIAELREQAARELRALIDDAAPTSIEPANVEPDPED